MKKPLLTNIIKLTDEEYTEFVAYMESNIN